ncbi:hypothetical protein [Mesorhizobium mediterraneum]|uniref:hypothetical protein n=1 Tax=Mesorhizobium mediterraneum TaxID=43617 RepID=UPI0017856FE6|nr:hypothetical protein [Mesorhizobium mediterraneum]
MGDKSVLGTVALGLGGSAVAGYGLGMGRDAWKATKKHSGTIMLLVAITAAFALPFLGGRNLVRGYRARWVSAWGIASGVLLIAAGWAVAVFLMLLLAGMTSDEAGTSGPAVAALLRSGGYLAAASAALGVLFGFFQRPGRRRRHLVAAKSEAYLDRMGFSETGEQEITHYDGEGNPLRLLERSGEVIAFLAVGKRNKRAYIRLGPDGEMTGYTGVIPIDAPREYQIA